jgi:putative tricarboxylic transport membrane protein
MLLRATVIVFAVLVTSALQAANKPFYQGKQLRMVINAGAGAPSDIEGRLFARHLSKHIDGNPTFVVQNIVGAGGLIGANYLGEIAPRDGTVVGLLAGMAWLYTFNPGRFRLDFKTYEFIAYQSSTAVHYIRTDTPPGIRAAADIVKAHEVISGGLGPENAKDLLIRSGLELLGVPNRHITPYRSSAAARLALQRGEIHLYSESPPSYRRVVHPGIVKEGLAIPLWHDPVQDGGKLAASKQVDGLGIMPYHEAYRTIKGTLPSGPLWEARLVISRVNGTMLRLLALPPHSPVAAADALRMAVARLSKDTAYADEAIRSIGFVPEYKTGPDTSRQVRNGLTVRPEIRAFIADYAKKSAK